MARGNQLARQWRILQSLIASRRGKSAADLARELEYHWRTVYRDLEALQLAGFPIFTDRVDGKNLWSILDSARQNVPIPLDLTEVMALYFSRGLMRVLKDTVFYESLESFFQKIKATLPAETIQYLEKIEQSFEVGSKPYKHYDHLRDVIDRISQATVDRQMIEIDYYTMSRKKRTRRKVAPYKIWLFDGAFYLVGNCGLREDIRIFALDRIKSLRLTDEIFEMPADFKVEDFMQTSFGVFHGEPQDVRIRFAPEVAGYIREKTWHATQKIKSQNDGSVIFEARVAGTDEIKYWLMSWGGKAEVLSPATLRDEILAEAKAMQHTYQR
ncbi:MAG: transcriptional regulator [Deltaproteobacteria bacterium]|jgi:predicted DNA-binding transcriptional regulator YafY|nr:transcriptional regulator [Deltaproteobacteria bacterium]MBW2469766.1 transcriptional regulator [Deltaproteobacteria bacterium]MBW2517425.1 transcriptional regulator [Deltaproteobacteria bacterium]